MSPRKKDFSRGFEYTSPDYRYETKLTKLLTEHENYWLRRTAPSPDQELHRLWSYLKGEGRFQDLTFRGIPVKEIQSSGGSSADALRNITVLTTAGSSHTISLDYLDHLFGEKAVSSHYDQIMINSYSANTYPPGHQLAQPQVGMITTATGTALMVTGMDLNPIRAALPPAPESGDSPLAWLDREVGRVCALSRA